MKAYCFICGKIIDTEEEQEDYDIKNVKGEIRFYCENCLLDKVEK